MAGTAVPVEIFTNNPSTTIAANGYAGGSATGDAPAALTGEAWTVSSSATFPAASSSATPPTQFRIADAAAPGEIILVTSVSGTTWTVTRGFEGTTPVTHAAGATFYQVITAGVLAALNPGDGDFYGNAASPPAQPLYGAQLYAAGGSLKSVNADGNAFEIGELTILGSAVTGATGTSAQNITGLSASLGPGSYVITVILPWEEAGTIGSTTKFGFAASGGLTLSALSIQGFIQGSSLTAVSPTSALVTSTALSAAMWTSPTHAGTAAWGLAMFYGTLTVSAAGTLAMVFENTTSADTANMGPSIMTLQPNN